MHYRILNKFIGKKVEVFIHGASHIGTLLHTESVPSWDDTGALLLQYDEKDFRAKMYGDLYIDTRSIDAIHEFVTPPVVVASLGEEPTYYVPPHPYA